MRNHPRASVLFGRRLGSSIGGCESVEGRRGLMIDPRFEDSSFSWRELWQWKSSDAEMTAGEHCDRAGYQVVGDRVEVAEDHPGLFVGFDWIGRSEQDEGRAVQFPVGQQCSEVGVFGDDHLFVGDRVVEDVFVGRISESDLANGNGVVTVCTELSGNAW
jgi:hypothetical protein